MKVFREFLSKYSIMEEQKKYTRKTPQTEYIKQYFKDNKERMNKRALLSYHNKMLKLPYQDIWDYENIHGLDETILWLKMQKLEFKLNKLAKTINK